MAISTPVGPIFSALKWMLGLAIKGLLLPTYRHSHTMWVARHRLGARWKKLGEHLEYSLHLATVTDPEPRASKIAIRATDQQVAAVSMIFEAESDAAYFQEQIRLQFVRRKATVWTLTHVPIQMVPLVGSEKGIRFAWDDFQFREVRVSLEDGTRLPGFDTPRSTLTHSWFLNSEWRNGWGRYWNLDAVKSAKEALAVYWRFELAGFRLYRGSRGPVQQRLLRLRVAVMKPIARLMGKERMIATQFWLAVWSGLFVMTESSGLRWRWAGDQSKDDAE